MRGRRNAVESVKPNKKKRLSEMDKKKEYKGRKQKQQTTRKGKLVVGKTRLFSKEFMTNVIDFFPSQLTDKERCTVVERTANFFEVKGLTEEFFS